MINRNRIFKNAHWNARVKMSNQMKGSPYFKSYAELFASALRFEYAKLKLAAEREAIRMEQNLGLPIRSVSSDRKLFIARRSISAVGA